MGLPTEHAVVIINARNNDSFQGLLVTVVILRAVGSLDRRVIENFYRINILTINYIYYILFLDQ